MLFKTIYFYSNTKDKELCKKQIKDELREIEEKPGIVVLNKYDKTIFAMKSFFIFYTDNINGNVNGILSDWKGTFGEQLSDRLSISYAVVENEVEMYKIYLDLIKNTQPIKNYHGHIEEFLSDLSNEKIITEKQFIENVLNDKVFMPKDIIDKELTGQEFKNFDKLNINNQPNTMGIYFVYGEEKELLYIGKSLNIPNRLSNHFDGNSNTHSISDNFKFFKYVQVEKNDIIDNVELYAINIYKPLLNLKDVYTYNSQRYSDKYNKLIKEYGCIENVLRINFAISDIKEKLNGYCEELNKKIITF